MFGFFMGMGNFKLEKSDSLDVYIYLLISYDSNCRFALGHQNLINGLEMIKVIMFNNHRIK